MASLPSTPNTTERRSLSELPEILIEEILLHLEVPEMVHCRELCSRVRDVIDDSDHLQDEIDYYIEEEVSVYKLRDVLPQELQAEDEAVVLNNAADYMDVLERSNELLEERLNRIFRELEELKAVTLENARRVLGEQGLSDFSNHVGEGEYV
ncbi:hypothetical protein NEOLEDRAFT_1175633 [Neolentinus lepideus HHB14362 ss-1]|uniref:F-box domain-containing protein n=1 Tax=Neolentinus lepideus HHB14362 ss-1 TaxID=1314782 RepID=A0A165UWA5_9AGAM|nr:hypothetical protein NEOLEDRAFT_1175633 [Neolentinus lepideus HHB14362 ss-1]